jgi:hypothetical protein
MPERSTVMGKDMSLSRYRESNRFNNNTRRDLISQILRNKNRFERGLIVTYIVDPEREEYLKKRVIIRKEDESINKESLGNTPREEFGI